MKLFTTSISALLVLDWSVPALAQNSTYYNPVLPGWHSDPSCTPVNGTFFCVTSTFISFPGLPIYASKDLLNFKHISHVWNRASQLPGYSYATDEQQHGMYAATIRHYHGTFYVICEYLTTTNRTNGVLFKTTDPFNDASWSDPVLFLAPRIDPDLFWDDDGKVYVATQDIRIQEIDIDTGNMGPVTQLWNGTGGVWPEGPHIYKKDGWYYLLIAEGGTAEDHAVTMARARNITGPYSPSPHNPHLTNRGTSEYFQTVGHADLFQDGNGKWWGTALATRWGSPNASYFPMGRETVLFPVTWNQGEWPIMQPVRGIMNGWELPKPSRDIPGTGPFNSDPDVYDFAAGSAIPRNLVYWRVPRPGVFSTTENGLQVIPGKNNLENQYNTTDPASKAISFIGRRQTDSTFKFSVDMSFTPVAQGQEAGITVFLTQYANVQLGVNIADNTIAFRFNSTESRNKMTPVPTSWVGKPIRLMMEMYTPSEYVFSATSTSSNSSVVIELGKASAAQVSGNTGSFVGTLIGVYATCNGAGDGRLDCPANTPKAWFKRWRYEGVRQWIDRESSVASGEFNQ